MHTLNSVRCRFHFIYARMETRLLFYSVYRVSLSLSTFHSAFDSISWIFCCLCTLARFFLVWLYQSYYAVFTSILFVLFDFFSFSVRDTFFFFIRHSFMDTWLSRLHWEFENNQFFPLCCFCCCNSDTNTQITRSNRMNVFWSRNRCSFFLLLFIFIGYFEFGHKKRTKIEHTHIDIRHTCIYT